MSLKDFKPATLASIGQCARIFKKHRTNVFKLLMRMHAEDRRQGQVEWLYYVGPKRKTMVNLDRLKKQHPNLFADKFATVEQVEELENRIERLEVNSRNEKQRLNANIARVRTLSDLTRSDVN